MPLKVKPDYSNVAGRNIWLQTIVQKRVWDYALVYEAEILSRIARGNGSVPGLETITGDTVDIMKYLDFANSHSSYSRLS